MFRRRIRLSEFRVLEDKEAAAALTAGAVVDTDEGSVALLVAETGKTTVQAWGFNGPSPGWASMWSLRASERAGRDALCNLLCLLAEGWEGCSI